MNPKVSVIVPVYNVEAYVDRCIISILNQSYGELEIVLINDGSNDGSCELCTRYVKQDSRIVMLSQINKGIATARNIGIDTAIGEYVTFVDSDDYIHPEAIRILVDEAKKSDADICIADFQRAQDGELRNTTILSSESRDITKMEAWSNLFGDKHIQFGCAWGKLYRKRLFKNLRFPDGHAYEDLYIIQHIYGISSRIHLINQTLYYYMLRDGSITREWNKKRMIDSLLATKNRYLYFLEQGNSSLIEKAADLHMRHAIHCYVLSNNVNLRKEVVELFNDVWTSLRKISHKDERVDYYVFACIPHAYPLYEKAKGKMLALIHLVDRRS